MSNFRKHISKKFSDYSPETTPVSLEELWGQMKLTLAAQQKEQERFSRYEPEVSDEKIEEAWNKIVFFLPKEEKKRRLLYLPLGCAVTAGLCFSVLVIFILAHRLMQSPSSGNVPLASYKNTTVQKAPQKNNSSPEQQSYSNITTKKKPMSFTVQKTNDKKQSGLVGIVSLEGMEKSLGPDARVAALADNIASVSAKDSVWQMNPVSVTLVQDVPEINLQYAPAHDTVTVKQNRWSTEIAGGINYPLSYFVVNGIQYKEQKELNACVSAALYYKLSGRLLAGVEFGLGQNKLSYSENKDGNLILSKGIVTGVSSVGSIDTVITYRPFKHTYKLTSAMNYYAGIGMEGSFFKRNKFSLSGSAFLRFTRSYLTYVSEHKPESNALTYLKTTSSGPLPNAVSEVNANPQKYTAQSLSAGLAAGINLQYICSKRVSLVLKPSACFNIKEFYNATVFKYKQHQFFVMAGIRYRW